MKTRLAVAVAGTLALAGCSSMNSMWDSTKSWAGALGGSGTPGAIAELKPTQGSATAGTVRFTQQGSKLIVTADITGLRPNAEHGFHVHDKGDCSAPDGMSAGGHFNPGGKPHAHHDQAERHAGDLPNLKSDANGHASYRWESDALAIGAGANNVIGRSVLVHRDPDDYKSQPAGNSGPRIACGLIVAAK